MSDDSQPNPYEPPQSIGPYKKDEESHSDRITFREKMLITAIVFALGLILNALLLPAINSVR